MTQFPDPLGERLEREQLQIELHQILVSRVRFGRRRLLCQFQTAQQVRCFDSRQFRRMQRAARQDLFGPDTLRPRISERRDQQRGIDNDAQR